MNHEFCVPCFVSVATTGTLQTSVPLCVPVTCAWTKCQTRRCASLTTPVLRQSSLSHGPIRKWVRSYIFPALMVWLWCRDLLLLCLLPLSGGVDFQLSEQNIKMTYSTMMDDCFCADVRQQSADVTEMRSMLTEAMQLVDKGVTRVRTDFRLSTCRYIYVSRTCCRIDGPIAQSVPNLLRCA